MKRTHLFGTMLACTLAAAVSVGAQERPTMSPSDRDSKTVTVTGCLKSAEPAASTTPSTAGTTGTAGTAGTTASARGFIITDAVVSNDTTSATGATGTTPTTAAPTTAGTSGTSPSATSPSIDSKTYAVVGGQSSELQPLLNSKVEISGTLSSNANRSAAGAGSTAAGGTGSTAGGTGSTVSGTGTSMAGMSHGSNDGQLRVTSVKQIAGSCGGQ